MSKIYSDKLSKAQSLLSGLKKNVDILKDKGFNASFISKMEANCQTANQYNKENEQLYIELKQKKSAASRQLLEVRIQMRDAKKMIKQDFPKERWIEFGITDRK